jgi:hypothetical protein
MVLRQQSDPDNNRIVGGIEESIRTILRVCCCSDMGKAELSYAAAIWRTAFLGEPRFDSARETGYPDSRSSRLYSVFTGECQNSSFFGSACPSVRLPAYPTLFLPNRKSLNKFLKTKDTHLEGTTTRRMLILHLRAWVRVQAKLFFHYFIRNEKTGIVITVRPLVGYRGNPILLLCSWMNEWMNNRP